MDCKNIIEGSYAKCGTAVTSRDIIGGLGVTGTLRSSNVVWPTIVQTGQLDAALRLIAVLIDPASRAVSGARLAARVVLLRVDEKISAEN